MKIVQVLILLCLLAIAYMLGQRSTLPLPSDNTAAAQEIPKKSPPNSVVKREPQASPPIIYDAEAATIRLFEEAAPSVVYITTSRVQTDYWRRRALEVPAGSGSGFVWDTEGHIVTNYHVIQGAERIKVTLSDQSTHVATLVGIEPNKDLAVLHINPPGGLTLRPIPLSRSADLKVGQSVFAIGNPFGLDYTLTTGVISALGREIESLTKRPIKDVIQTDAAINPGNSGGPLLDRNGRLIGVNTQIYSPSGASAGIGFSIPVDEVNWVVPDLIAYGEVRRPAIGVSLLPDQYAQRWEVDGAMIAETHKGSPAEQAGLRGIAQDRRGSIIYGDIVKRVFNTPIKNNNDLILALEKLEPGDKVSMEVERDGQDMRVEVILGIGSGG